jgi:hypothetical protein
MLFVGRESRGGPGFCRGASLPYRTIGLLKKKICRNFGNSEIMEIGRQRRLQLWTSSKGHRPRSTVVISNRRMAEFAIAAAPNLIQFERRPVMLSSSRSLSLLDLHFLGKLRAALLSDKVTATELFTRATCLPQRGSTERQEYLGISHQCHEELKPEECEFLA